MTRPFDKHLDSDELDRLVSLQQTSVPGSEPLSEHTLRDAQRHVESCPDCSRKLQRYKFVQSEILRMPAPNPSPRTPECVGDAEWLAAAAGLFPEAKTRELMKHAAKCGHCGPLLKNAAEALVDEPTPSEESWLASLPSARPEWRKHMAEQLRAGAATRGALAMEGGREKKEKGARRPALFSWPRPVFALAGIAAAVVAGWLGMRLLRPPSAEQLLARAYTEHRTLEVRIPGAKYAPMRVERAAGGSSLDKSPSLLKAEALIGDNLQKSPNDPVWLQAKARADLLEGNYESAIKSLQRALETKPEDPPLLTDLGSAYFVRAEAADRAIDYGDAIESLSKALAKSPDDPVALFNRALACERMFLYTQAIDDWQHYLRVDPQGEWAEDAHANLQRIKQRMAEREKRTAIPLLSPKEFSAAIEANHDDAVALLDQRAERYLAAATQSWLPLAYGASDSDQVTPAEASRALEHLAEILQSRHDDNWLSDFLQSPPSPTEKEAVHGSVASDEALHAGRYGLAAELAQKSMQDFRLSKNQAGMLRASFALMMAQSFALRYSDCDTTAARAVLLLSNTRYRWLQSQTLIQRGECVGGGRGARIEDAIQNSSSGAEAAHGAHYLSLELRALAFGAEYRSETGRMDTALRSLLPGLTAFWRSDVSNTRGENLYETLISIAGVMNWRHVEVWSMAEELGDFPPRDPVDQVVGWEILAGAEERAGDYKAAGMDLQRAAARVAAFPEDNGIILRKAEIAVENARIQLDLGDPEGASAALAPLRQEFETADPGLFQANYFLTYGEANLALGRQQAAEPLLERALSITEAGLIELRSEADRLSWSRTRGEIYRDLLEIRLNSESPAQALAWWEWYKGASLRETKAGKYTQADDARSSFTPPDPSTYRLPPGTALISYVVLKKSTIAFVSRDGNVQSRFLQLPDDSQLQALRFLSLCADPLADLASLNRESRRLYDLLVAPLDSDIQGAAALWIETDGILDRIPFDLLQGPDDRYLADRFVISYSPGLAYASNVRPGILSSSSPALIVVASAAQGAFLPPLPDAQAEGSDVASCFREASLLSGSRANRTDVLQKLRDAGVFHFVGHATANGDKVGLVLGPDAVLNWHDLVNMRPKNLRLAVLSACDTANGDDGTFADLNSVARNLTVLGVPQTVASRWNVDSAVTRQLMRAFYSNLMSGKTPAASLAAARNSVRNSPGHQHPYYWGAFAVFGSA